MEKSGRKLRLKTKNRISSPRLSEAIIKEHDILLENN
jgi:hypothetical protein